jgi:hypothetical protein
MVIGETPFIDDNVGREDRIFYILDEAAKPNRSARVTIVYEHILTGHVACTERQRRKGALLTFPEHCRLQKPTTLLPNWNAWR